MPEQLLALPPRSRVALRHANGEDELTACFPVISQLQPALKEAAEWMERGSDRWQPMDIVCWQPGMVIKSWSSSDIARWRT